MDIPSIIHAAKSTSCTFIHPGYGFLSESPDFAHAINAAGLHLIGPSASALTTFGSKTAALDLARRAGLPTLESLHSATPDGISPDDAHSFLTRLRTTDPTACILLKPLHGGGGRGIRSVMNASEIPTAFAQAQREALASCGSGTLYAERLLARARHVEVQILGDGKGNCVHLCERDCTLQRRRQKVVEVCPSPAISPKLRGQLVDGAVKLLGGVAYEGLGTVEFLVDDVTARHWFMEVNPRIQVEHAVTEELFGVDLVRAQLDVALARRGFVGSHVRPLGVVEDVKGSVEAVMRGAGDAMGYAIQCRVNAETMGAGVGEEMMILPSSGTVRVFAPPPTALGVR
ncbi:hypothetical protein HK101_005408, partial [Irineochytrium annulatum]